MIQSALIKAYPDRDDKVFWAIQSDEALESVTGVTRCVLVFKKDDENDVIIDSEVATGSFNLADTTIVRGQLVKAISWNPSVVLSFGRFTVIGIWKADVYLYDDVHTDGVFHGQFEMYCTVTSTGGGSGGGGGVAVTYLDSSLSLTTPYPTANTTMTFDVVSCNVSPVTYPNAIVLVSVNIVSTSTAGGMVAPTSITIGGIEASVLWKKGTPEIFAGQTHLALAMVRIPPGGLVSPTVVVTWPSIITAGTLVRVNGNVFYHVDPSSDGFALGHVEVDSSTTAGSLSAPQGGAVVLDTIMYTGGDVAIQVWSVVDSTFYTMMPASVEIFSGHYFKTGYRLFAGALSESVSPFVPADVFIPVIAFVLAGG